MNQSSLKKLINFSILLAFCVLMLGAYTRLSDAGLGCPDWPGCYGHLLLPNESTALHQAQQQFPGVPIETEKAWTEMIHRYLAGSLLGLIVLILGCLSFKYQVSLWPRLALVALLVFQALLGMWTVSLKLFPPVVTGHLLGGFLILVSLVALRCQLSKRTTKVPLSWRILVMIGFILSLIQIILGAWVSSNYAGISCMGFPSCNASWWPVMHWSAAFNVFHHIGPNYQGGLLPVDVRMTIQYVHRIGALIVWLYWLVFAAFFYRKIANKAFRRALILLECLLILQISLGIINVLWMLPMPAAVLHNGVAAAILVSIVLVFHFLAGDKNC